MILRPPRSTRTDPRLPYTTFFRSVRLRMFRTLDALLVTRPARHGMDGIRGLPRCSNYRTAPLSRSSTPAVRAVARSVPEATGANADTDAGNDDGRTVADRKGVV